MKPLLWCLWLLLRVFAFLRPTLKVSPGGKDYLVRWYLTPSGEGRFAKWYRRHLPGVFLHCFLSSDPDRGWHSHPWTWACSLILRGEYQESRPMPWSYVGFIDDWHYYEPGKINTLTGADWHRVKLLTPKVWTLFVVGPLHGIEWHFMDERGTIKPHGTNTPGD
jgi:hypothetical protein